MISKRLKEIRELKGLSQIDFAKKLSVLPTTISKYERGEIKPTADFFANLCNVFDTNINWLLTGDGEMFVRSYDTRNMVADSFSAYSESNPNIRSVLTLMRDLPDEEQKFILKFCQNQKLLHDLTQERIKKGAG